MGNHGCSSKSQKIPSKLLFAKNDENYKYVSSGNQAIYDKLNSETFSKQKNIPKTIDFKGKTTIKLSNSEKEIIEAFHFQKTYTNYKQLFELNPGITRNEQFVNIQKSNKPKFSALKSNNSSKPLINSEKPRKSFKELFKNDETLYLPYKQPEKTGKETKNSTPYFDRQSNGDNNELLPYLLPLKPQLSPEEKPRKLMVEKEFCESLHKSKDSYPAKTIQEFSMSENEEIYDDHEVLKKEPIKFYNKKYVSESDEEFEESSEEPQHIHINLFDLLQNELKTRRNSLSIQETPIKDEPKKEKIKKNDSQSSFKTLKKMDFIPPLSKNTIRQSKERLNLSKKP